MNDREKKFIPDEDVYLFNTGSARKAWLCFGCRYIPELGAHRFVVWAPNAQRVSLVGDFNSWDRAATPMGFPTEFSINSASPAPTGMRY